MDINSSFEISGKHVPPLEKGAARRAGDGSASERRNLRKKKRGHSPRSGYSVHTFTNSHTGAIIKPTQGKRLPFSDALREETAGESLGRRKSFHSGAAGDEPDGL